MTIKIVEKTAETINICDLIDSVKTNPRIIECGAIFSFEGIVRGKEVNKNTTKMDLTTPDLKETENELTRYCEGYPR